MKRSSDRPLKIVQVAPIPANPDSFLAIDGNGRVWIGEVNWSNLPPSIDWIVPDER